MDNREDQHLNYEQCEHDADGGGKTEPFVAQNGFSTSRNHNVQQLLTENLRTKSESESLFEIPEEVIKGQESSASLVTPGANSFPIEDVVRSQQVTNTDIVELTSAICDEGQRCHLQWLQRLLLEACYVKLDEYKGNGIKINRPEPIILNYSLKRQSIPIVPYNEEQERALECDSFNQLLQKLGFHLPVDVDKIFPRIPCFWTSDVLFTVAGKLGPITSDMLKFDPNLLRKRNELTYPEELPTILGHADFYEKTPKKNCVAYMKTINAGENLRIPLASFNWKNDVTQQPDVDGMTQLAIANSDDNHDMRSTGSYEREESTITLRRMAVYSQHVHEYSRDGPRRRSVEINGAEMLEREVSVASYSDTNMDFCDHESYKICSNHKFQFMKSNAK